MKRFFDEELQSLWHKIEEMGGKALEQMRLAVKALQVDDVELAGWIRTQDDELDRMEMEIDAQAIRYMSLRAPVAKELRKVVMAMNVAHEIERVGDEACNIAKRVQKLAHLTPVGHVPDDLQDLATGVEAMIEEALNAFRDGDTEKALKILRRDEYIDQIFKRLNKSVTQRTLEDPSRIPAAIEFLFAARSLERIGDHATNIAEEVVYIQRGQDIRHSPLKDM